MFKIRPNALKLAHLRKPRSAGFTLMEVIIAIALLGIVTAISWRGLDGMIRTQSALKENSDALSITKTSFDQWNTDLNAVANIPNLTAVDWDGKVFRITRMLSNTAINEPSTIQVVAWTDRTINGKKYWMRWHSPALYSRGQWQNAWQQAQEWARQSSAGVTNRQNAVALIPITQWEIFYYRGGSWVNPQSNQQNQILDDDSSPGSLNINSTSASSLPDSIRLRVQIASSEAINGWLTVDWLNPLASGARL